MATKAVRFLKTLIANRHKFDAEEDSMTTESAKRTPESGLGNATQHDRSRSVKKATDLRGKQHYRIKYQSR